MDWSTIGLTALDLFSPVLAAVISWAALKLGQFIKAKIDHEYLESVLYRLNDSVWTVVKDLNQTVVGEVKKAAADGKITKEESQAIKAQALSMLKSYLGVKGLAELGKVLGLGDGALDAFLGSKIEAAVSDTKVLEGNA